MYSFSATDITLLCIGKYFNIVFLTLCSLFYIPPFRSLTPLNTMEGENSCSRNLLATACSVGDYDHAQKLLATGADPVTSRAGYFNWSPLHYTARLGRLDFAKMLISQYGCHPMVEDKEGRTPLHIACQHGHLDYARYLIKQKRCDVQYGDIEDLIPLYHACGWLSECTDEQALILSKFLVSSAKCDPNTRDMNGKNAVLHAGEKGFLSVLRYFIEECKCDASSVDYRKNNVLHLAISFCNNFKVVCYIIGLHEIDLASVNNMNNNILHMAAIANSSLDVCKKILASTDSSMLESLIEGKNCREETPLDLARPELARLLLSCYTVKNSDYYKKHALSLGMKQPQVPQPRIFVVGDASAGKSSLIQSLQKESASFSSSFSLSFTPHSQRSSLVVIEQAHVVVTTEFKSKFYGEVQFYDLNGSSECQYIHNVMMPHFIHPHLSLFLVVIDFSRPIEEINTSFYHWLSILCRACRSCKERMAKPKVLVIGSHSDVVKSHETKSPREKLRHLTFNDSSSDYDVVCSVLLDCQKSESSGINVVRKQLSTLCEQIKDNNELPFNACCLLMFIKSNYGSCSAVSLESIIASVKSYTVENGVIYDLRYFLSDDASVLVPLLDQLSKSSDLLFLKNETVPSRSLIVPDVSHLCSELAQSINCEFKHIALKNSHKNLLTLSNIERLFQDQDPHDMLQILSHLKLTVGNGEMSKQFPMITTEEVLYYCPSLLTTNLPPSNLWDAKSMYAFHFGWRMEASQCDHHFSLHFVHTILLQLFFIIVSSAAVKHFSLWRNGLYMESDTKGIEVLIHTSDGSKAVSLIMRSKECSTACIKYRSIITRTVRNTFKEYYSHVEPVELIMDPFYSRRHPLLPRECLTLFDSRQVLETISSGSMVVKSTDGVTISIKELLLFEPYSSIGRYCLSELLKVKHKDIVTDSFFRSLAVQITENNNKVNLVAAMFSVVDGEIVTAESLRVSLHSDPTYQNIIQSLEIFSCIDSTLLVS